jgi:hypothetical protein
MTAPPTISSNLSATEPAKKPRGCFFYGCITCLALFFLAFVLFLLGSWYVIHTLNALVAEYTDTAPVTLPTVDMPPGELAKLEERVNDFKHALDAHTNTPPLILTSREINAFMADNPHAKEMKLNDKLFVNLDGDKIKGQASLPLDYLPKVPFVHTAGRYLNVTGEFGLGVTNAALSLNITSLEARGKPLPPWFMSILQQKNITDSFNRDPTNTAEMSRFESIEVKDSNLIIKAKSD